MTEAFWAKVDKSGPVHPVLGTPCWLWTSYRYRDQYGDFAYKLPNGRRKHQGAHRVALTFSLGRRLAAGMEACHRCDNPPCCNPDHLFEGTHSQNERDKVAKRRNDSPFGRIGERSLQAKLTDAQAVEIRFLAQSPVTRFEAIAARFGISVRAVHDVVSGNTYGHLTILEAPRRLSKRSPRDGDQLRCSKCRMPKALAEFPPSVARRGSGWCCACYAAWAQARKP